MRLLHSCQTLSRSFGGVFEAVRQLGAQQAAQFPEWQIQVLGASDRHREDDRAFWGGLKTLDYHVVGPKAFGWSPTIHTHYRDFDPEICHVHGLWMYYGMANRQFALRRNMPYIISPHGMLDSWALQNSPHKKRFVRWLFEDRHLAGAACLHALCREEAAAIRKAGFRNPICVIPNGVHLPERRLTTPPPWTGRVSVDSRIMLFLGRLHPKKGLDNLIQAWHSIVGREPTPGSTNWRLVIAGWGTEDYLGSLQQKVLAAGLADDVLFIGPIFGEAKAAALHHADAFILPSFSEGLPMAVLEAWSHAVPVLMTPECNLAVGFEQNAAVCLGTTVKSLSDPLLRFLQQPECERNQLGKNGFQLAVERFTWTRISDDFRRVYNWVLGSGLAPDDLLFD